MSNKSNEDNIVSIMDIDFVNLTKKDLLSNHLHPHLNREQKCYVVTANPEIVMKTKENAEYKSMIESADYIIPDGAGIVMASRFMKKPIHERVPGFELMMDLLEYANSQGLSCYFLGAKEHVNEKMVLEVEKRYPNITIAGHHHGYISNEGDEISKEMKAASPDLVFVALGSPKQEIWITQHINQFSKGLFMGVGGSFDVLAGEVKRAPDSWIKMNLEWLYRLLRQPFRWKRILKSLEFMVRIALKKA